MSDAEEKAIYAKVGDKIAKVGTGVEIAEGIHALKINDNAPSELTEVSFKK